MCTMRPDSKENTATNVSWKTNIKGNHCLKHGSDNARIKRKTAPKQTNLPTPNHHTPQPQRFKAMLGTVWSTTLPSAAAVYSRFTNANKTALVFSKQINACLCSEWLLITPHTPPQISEDSSQFHTQKHFQSFPIFFVFLIHHLTLLNFKKHFFKAESESITSIAKHEKKLNAEYKQKPKSPSEIWTWMVLNPSLSQEITLL